MVLVLIGQTISREKAMYDIEHEAKCCANELYYRNGSRPEPLALTDAEYVAKTIELYMREAAKNAAHRPDNQ